MAMDVGPGAVEGCPAGRRSVRAAWHGVGVVFKIDGADTGVPCRSSRSVRRGGLVPPHIHHLEDEYSIVLKGEIGFRS